MARKGNNKSKKELEAENRFLKRQGAGENTAKVANQLIKYGAFAVIAYFISVIVDSLAGKKTNANIEIKGEGTLALDQGGQVLPLVVVFLTIIWALAATAYGRNQARLRRNTVERLHWYQEQWERNADPRRSSSRLTSRGETRPEDSDD